MNLQEIINNSTFEVLDDIYNVAKINSDFKSDNIFMRTIDLIEGTAIYKDGTATEGVLEEKKGYKLIGINVAIPFYSPGFISTITSCLAKQNISVLVVSTYSRDYFIVSEVNVSIAVQELKKIGIKMI